MQQIVLMVLTPKIRITPAMTAPSLATSATRLRQTAPVAYSLTIFTATIVTSTALMVPTKTAQIVLTVSLHAISALQPHFAPLVLPIISLPHLEPA